MRCTGTSRTFTHLGDCQTLREDWLRSSVLAIGAITVVSGAVQAAAPRFVLGLVGADRSTSSAQLFGTVGAFMVVVGGALSHATVRDSAPQVVALWSTLQKVSAVAAVGMGVRAGVFKPRSLSVAAFDLASAGVLAAFALRIWKQTSQTTVQAVEQITGRRP